MAKTKSESEYRLSLREVDTILAALRTRQWNQAGQPIPDDAKRSFEKIAAEHGEPLSFIEIEKLCRRINCDE